MADAFNKAARVLGISPELMLLAPVIMNATFALELYLKSLNMEWQIADSATLGNGKAWVPRSPLQKGHIPSKLYGALNESIKNDLEQKYREHIPNERPQSLEEALKAQDGNFQKWRYIFEEHGKPVDLSELFALLAFFSEVINTLPKQYLYSA